MKKKAEKMESLPKLVITRKSAIKKIVVQIDKGNKIKEINITDKRSLEKTRKSRRRWSDYNTEMLLRMFSNSSIADDYDYFGGAMVSMNPSFEELVDDFEEDVDESINRLQSIKDKLELIPEKEEEKTKQIGKQIKGKKVFLVHGHDELAKETVARFLEKLGLIPIILHEQPNKGKTIIEKLEAYSDVSFAIVLLTPDDRAMPKDRPEEQELRARQNVIFEFGFFIGKLDRSKVVALYKKGVVMPSDYSGVVYIEMDYGNGWQLKLAKDIKEAGLTVDLNKL